MSDIVCSDLIDSRTVIHTISALCHYYPFLHRTVIGQSVCGRPIEALSIGHSEQAVLFVAGIRAQEHTACVLSLRLAEALCRMHGGEAQCDKPAMMRSLLNRTVVIVPLLNPDGIDIALYGSASGGCHADLLHAHGADIKGYWQANAVGVELSSNFNVERDTLQKEQLDHGITGPCGCGFGGTSPESEPESRALAGLCRRMSFSHAVTLSCGDSGIRWQYTEHTPPHARMTARFLAHAGHLPLAPPSHPITRGGFREWFMQQFGRPAFDIAVPVCAHSPADLLFHRVKDALLLAAVL